MTPEFQPVARTIPLSVYREASRMVQETGQTHWIYWAGAGIWAIEPTRNPDVMADAVIAPRATRSWVA